MFATDERLVDLDHSAITAEWSEITSAQCLADTVSKEPRSFMDHLWRGGRIW